MSFTEISMYTIFIGGAFTALGLALMLVLFVIGFLPFNEFLECFQDRIFKIFQGILYLGLFVCLFGIAGMTTGMVIEGISTGEYNLRLNRYDRGKTQIDWENRPIRFAFQTTMFIGVSIYTIYFAVKTLRNNYKKTKK